MGEALFLAGNNEEALLEFDAERWEGFTQYGRAMTYYRLEDQGVLGAEVFPFYDNLRDDPSFADFVRRLKAGRDL